MSANDLKAILNSPEAFLFLPTVNYVYLFATMGYRWEFILCCAAGLSCALVYNILDGIPASKATNVRLGVTGLLITGVISWVTFLFHSTFRLYNSFTEESIIHELLFFTSLVFFYCCYDELTITKV